jgi:hypothetical protein
MYGAWEMLARIDAHPYALIAGLAIAMLFQTVWMISAIRVARRDQAYSVPLPCTFLWFAHDVGFVIRLGHWSSVYDHWFLYLFWIGLFSATVLELVFFAQIIRYGHQEIAAGLTRPQFKAVTVAAAVGTVIAWEYLRSLVDDPLYMASSALTLMSFALFGPALYLRRGGPRGQNLVMWVSFTAMTFTWWLTTAIYLPSAFHSRQYLAVGVFSLIVGMVMSAVLIRRRRRESLVPAARGRESRDGALLPGSLPG